MHNGALMLDLESTALSEDERLLLALPQVGGVILFTRNYQSPPQLSELISAIRQVNENLVIAVDQEGGRVQRFQEGFTRLPAMSRFGLLYRQSARKATELATLTGWLMAAELIAHDIDLSFAPVLDMGRGVSSVIGDRAFADNPAAIVKLAGAFINGMHAAGMSSTGKHFPGHGAIEGDSHHLLPSDPRTYPEIANSDLLPFKNLIAQLDAIMPAHLLYPSVDSQPAGFSAHWIGQVLRGQLGFSGLIFSDDLSMEGAAGAGDYADRAALALNAGCDVVLVCNNRAGAEGVIRYLQDSGHPGSPAFGTLRHRGDRSNDPRDDPRWSVAITQLDSLVQEQDFGKFS